MVIYRKLVFLIFVMVNRTKCDSSCKDGYYRSPSGSCKLCPEHCVFCESEKYCLICETGYAGDICEKHCSNCLPGTSCEKKDGFCSESCKNGLSGVLCNVNCTEKCMSCERLSSSQCVKCAHNRYGESCNNTCPSACRDNTCNENDGVCTSGCADGFWGKFCEHRCAETCEKTVCQRESGVCSRACDVVSPRHRCLCPRYCDCDTEERCTNCSAITENICGRNCSEECDESFCSRQTGKCSENCVVGTQQVLCYHEQNDASSGPHFYGLFAILLIIPIAGIILVIIYKKRVILTRGYPFPRNKLLQTNIEKNWRLLEFLEENRDSIWKSTLTDIVRSINPLTKRKLANKSCTTEDLEKAETELLPKQKVDKSSVKKLFKKRQPANETLKEDPEEAGTELLTTQNVNESSIQNPLTKMKLANKSCTTEDPEKAVTELLPKQKVDKSSIKKLFKKRQPANETRAEDLEEAGTELLTTQNVNESSIQERLKKRNGDDESCVENDPEKAERGLPSKQNVDECFIKGFGERNAGYIAWKGPTTDRLSEFWSMIWQKQCQTIVMLTGPREPEDRYWPEGEENQIYGDIAVICLEAEEVNATYIKRLLTISKGTGGRLIHHFQLTEWLYGKEAEASKRLLEIRQAVKHTYENGPILVHCSAGHFRTRTFIALDILMADADHCGSVNLNNVYPCVRTLRQQSESMVGSLEQYELLHYLLHHARFVYDEKSKVDETTLIDQRSLPPVSKLLIKTEKTPNQSIYQNAVEEHKPLLLTYNISELRKEDEIDQADDGQKRRPDENQQPESAAAKNEQSKTEKKPSFWSKSKKNKSKEEKPRLQGKTTQEDLTAGNTIGSTGVTQAIDDQQHPQSDEKDKPDKKSGKKLKMKVDKKQQSKDGSIDATQAIDNQQHPQPDENDKPNKKGGKKLKMTVDKKQPSRIGSTGATQAIDQQQTKSGDKGKPEQKMGTKHSQETSDKQEQKTRSGDKIQKPSQADSEDMTHTAEDQQKRAAASKECLTQATISTQLVTESTQSGDKRQQQSRGKNQQHLSGILEIKRDEISLQPNIGDKKSLSTTAETSPSITYNKDFKETNARKDHKPPNTDNTEEPTTSRSSQMPTTEKEHGTNSADERPSSNSKNKKDKKRKLFSLF